MTPEPCSTEGDPAGFFERYPDKGLYSWSILAEVEFADATCVHEASDINLLAVGIVESAERVRFAVDFDNGYLYDKVAVRSFNSSDYEPDMVLSDEAIAELRAAIDEYRVTDWPLRPPGEPTTDYGEFSDPNTVKLVVVFSDDTGNYINQPTRSDPDMVGFMRFAQKFIAEQLG